MNKMLLNEVSDEIKAIESQFSERLNELRLKQLEAIQKSVKEIEMKRLY